MPLDVERLEYLRKLLRSFTQTGLARAVGLTQSQISGYERGLTTNIPSDHLETLATVLDCTTDFLLGRTWVGMPLERAASQMAFDVFADHNKTTDEQRRRCRNVLGHPNAPLTGNAWITLAALIDRAVPPHQNPNRLILAVNDD